MFLGLVLVVGVAIFVFSDKVYYKGGPAENFDGERFFNPGEDFNEHKFSDVRKLHSDPRPDWAGEAVEAELASAKNNSEQVASEVGGIKVTMIGHASILIQIHGVNILTDPVFSDRASPVSFFGPKRFRKPGIDFDALPKIDAVLISHNHYDHTDLPTIKKLLKRDNPRFIVPLGNDTILKSVSKNIRVEAFNWWDCTDINDDVFVCLVPAKHWSSRRLRDRRRAFWSGFVIKSKTKPEDQIYFAGDTGYGTGQYFKSIFERHGNFKVAFIPIGAYEPRWFMKNYHLNPREAVQVWEDVGRPLFVPIHDRVFQLSAEGYNQPRGELFEAMEKLGVAPENVKYLEMGEGVEIDSKNNNNCP